MDKYTLLVVLNVPFVAYGVLKAFELYKHHTIGRPGLLMRLFFWLVVLVGLVFTQPIYEFLTSENLTNSPPLSLADVVLVTGLNFTLFLCTRAYSRLDTLERRFSALHEELSIKMSPKK